MLKKCLLVGFFIAALSATVAAQSATKSLTNSDVVTMFKGGLGESTIISAIQSQDTDFDISAMALLQLKKSGIPPKVMDAVIGAARKQKAANDAAAAAAAEAAAKEAAAKEAAAKAALPPVAAGQPSVLMLQGDQKQVLPADRTQIAQTKTKASTLGSLASDGTLMQAMTGVAQGVATAGMMKPGSMMGSGAMMAMPMVGPAMMAGKMFSSHHKPSITDVWAIGGQKSQTVIHNNQPAFEVHCDGIPGVNADEYEPVLVKLESTSNNFRLVGATEARQDALQTSAADWGMYSSFVEERVESQATKAGSGSYKLQPSAALAAGEYAVVLRPINKDKKFSGNSVAQNTGDGLMFNSVWSFEVQ
ncbi:MAG TPA: hypothetical protein VEJ67_09595 [Candidatus Cybelea sp.]|nr:hypothetical protein [Candidatus Cybelea sp.]